MIFNTETIIKTESFIKLSTILHLHFPFSIFFLLFVLLYCNNVRNLFKNFSVFKWKKFRRNYENFPLHTFLPHAVGWSGTRMRGRHRVWSERIRWRRRCCWLTVLFVSRGVICELGMRQLSLLISHRHHHRIITFKINKRIITWELELSLNLIMFHNLNSKLAFMYLPPFHIIWDNLRMNISHVWRYTIT